MINTRVIPCLLLKDAGLVKTIKFQNPRYVGDPINAVRIFNTREVPELILLDILATRENRRPLVELISKIADECSMPFSVGGVIKDIASIRALLNLGAEKVVINTYGIENPSFIKEASNIFGSQSIVVSVDAKRLDNGSYEVFTYSGTIATGIDPVNLAVQMSEMGAGELFLNSIDKDGTMEGYDLELIKEVSQAVSIPVIACGGAGRVEDFNDAVKIGHASAVAAGSMFVFHGRRHAVLISFPTQEELECVPG